MLANALTGCASGVDGEPPEGLAGAAGAAGSIVQAGGAPNTSGAPNAGGALNAGGTSAAGSSAGGSSSVPLGGSSAMPSGGSTNNAAGAAGQSAGSSQGGTSSAGTSSTAGSAGRASGGAGTSAGGSPNTAGQSAVGGTSNVAGSTSSAGSSAAGSPAMGSCEGHSNLATGLVGWATLNGGTTGGKGGTRIVVSTGAELVAALKAKQDSTTPLTIVVNGTITPANSGDVSKIDVKDVRDVSIIGAGAGAEFNGIGIKVVRASNIVLRNLRIHHVDIGDKDAISIEGPADRVWVDHCELYSTYQGVSKDFYDGLLDAKAEAEYLTFSWNYFHDSWKTSLAGSSESDTFDRKLTLHHNYFKNCNSRLPLFRGGRAHIFNNYYQDIVETAINSRLGACVRIENNYFSNVRNPWVSAFSGTLGGGELICNVLADGSAFAYSDEIYELPACKLDVPYEYSSVLNATERVPAIVMANAGVGKLQDPEAF